MSPRLTVVIGIIRRSDGHYLIGQIATGRHANRWEFPGGKVETGESLEQALRRELKEELGINTIIGDEVFSCNYPDDPSVRLVYLLVEEFYGGAPRPHVHLNLRWEPIERLTIYPIINQAMVDCIAVLSTRVF